VTLAKWLVLALLALPMAELVVFIVVASEIGFPGALLLALATSLAGGFILRSSGRAHMRRMRAAAAGERIAVFQADATGMMVMVAGILLLIPGFITDLAGVLLLVAPLRRFVGNLVRRRAARSQSERDGIVDLAPDEWQQVPEERLTHRPPRADDTGRHQD
jgi:UPF0716 protein FxsA